MTGRTLSHYRLTEKIGEGGMGEVWKAVDTKLGRTVAIKILPPGLAQDDDRRLRFQREARAAAALNHPNIAVIHEVDEFDGTDFIVMEHIDGVSLRERIGRGGLSIKQWLELAIPMAEGVAHAHAHGIVHRDLKPDNVMINVEQQVKLLDFGLAKLFDAGESKEIESRELQSRLETISQELTREGKVYGTASYMSPEQARGEATDHRSDMFSLGVVMYQMAGGDLPFKRGSTVETLHAIIADEPRPLSEIRSDLPLESERIVRKLMEKEQQRRYQDAADLVADLRNLQRDLDTDRVSVTSAVAPVQRGRKRLSWGLIAVLAVVVIALLMVPWILGRFGEAEREVTADTRTVGVIGFENLNDPADTEHLSRMLSGLITTDLVESGGIDVVSTARVLAALKQLTGPEGARFETSLAADVARTAGVSTMLVGQVDQVGEGLLLTAELVDVERGTAVASFTERAESRTDLFTLAGTIAEKVRRSTGGDKAETPRPFDLAQALTSSPDAYRHYAAGELAYHEFRLGEAVEHFRRAIDEDPTFALAYYRRSNAFAWNGQHQEAVEAIVQGLPYIERLPPHWQTIYEATHGYELGDVDDGYLALLDLVESSTEIPDAYYMLGEIATHYSRFFDLRLARDCFENTLEIDPTYQIALFHLFEDYAMADDIAALARAAKRYRAGDERMAAVAETLAALTEGDHERAIRVAESNRSDDFPPFLLMRTLVESGRWDRAIELANEWIPETRNELRAIMFSSRAAARIGRGELSGARSDLQEALVAADVTRPSMGFFAATTAMIQSDLARVLAAAGDRDHAVEAAREASRIDPYSSIAHYWLGSILLEAGREREAETVLAEAKRKADASPSPVTFFVDLLTAELRLAEKDYDGALRELERAAAAPLEYRSRRLERLVRARVLDAAGDHRGALDAYRESLEPDNAAPYTGWSGPLSLTLTLYRMARLEEKLGDVHSARRHYREFLDRWGNADLPIPEVAEARTRLAAL